MDLNSSSTCHRIAVLSSLRRTVTLFTVLLLGGCAAISERQATPGDTAQAPAEVEAPPATPISPSMLYRILVGEVAGQRGEIGASVAHYLDAARESRDPRVAERALRIAVYARQNDAALEAARRWVELAPDNPEARQGLAALALQAGYRAEALTQLQSLVASGSAGEQIYPLVSTLLARDDDREAALELMKELLALDSANPEAQFAYARLALHAAKAELALQHVELALGLRADWPEAEILRARLLAGQDQAAQARSNLERAVARHPEHVELRTSYARLLVEMNELKLARREFKRIAALEPENDDVLLTLGLLALDAEQLDDADTYLLRLLDLRKRQQEARYYLGRVATLRGDQATAIDWYSQVDEGQHWLDAQVRIARLTAEMGDLDAARGQLQALRARQPKLATRLLQMEGDLLMEFQDNDSAMALYTEGVEASPDDLEIRYARALLAEKLDRIDLTESDLLYVLEKEPEHIHALNALGYTLADRTERYQEALDYISKALMLAPEDPAVIDSMGWVNYRMGNYDEASTHLQRAFELTGDGEIGAHLGEVLWVMGRQDEARRVWEEARKSHPDNPVLLQTLQRLLP